MKESEWQTKYKKERDKVFQTKLVTSINDKLLPLRAILNLFSVEKEITSDTKRLTYVRTVVTPAILTISVAIPCQLNENVMLVCNDLHIRRDLRCGFPLAFTLVSILVTNFRSITLRWLRVTQLTVSEYSLS